MTRAHRISNLIGAIVPFIAFLAAIALLWNEYVGWHDLALMAGMYLVTGLGITIGFHRLLTHRAFQTSKPMEYVFAVLGSMAVEGSVDHWVADHRKHHAHTDVEGDPHSPHVGHGDGFRGAVRGLLHAHMGWMLSEQGGAQRTKYAKDLIEDRGMRWISKNFHILATVSLLLPAALGWLITGRLTGALTGFLWGGLVRVFLLHHVTWSINSVCHFFGRRRFATDDHSTNVAWLSLISFGESWHHNHHAFPRSAVHGLRRREIDPSAAVIWALEKLGLIWNVTRIPRDRQESRLAAGA
jgi:stearoyl-CoA desaturase (delta-9 desaturase)